MKYLLLLSLLLPFLGMAFRVAAAPAPLPKRIKHIRVDLRGEWKMVRWNEQDPSQYWKGIKLIITPNRATYHTEQRSGSKSDIVWLYSINERVAPMAIDLRDEDDEITQIHHSIFRLEADTLTICYPGNSTTSRPTEFTSNNRCQLYVFTRVRR